MNQTLLVLANLALAIALLRCVQVPAGLRPWLILLATIALASSGKVISLLWSAPFALSLALPAVAALSISRIPRASGDAPVGPAPNWTRLAFIAATSISLLAVILRLFRFPDGGNDAFIIWNLRARWLFLAPDARSAFSPDILFWTHQDYPLLLPGAVVQGFALAGSASRVVPAVIALLFGAALVGISIAGAPPDKRWLVGFALVTTPALVTQIPTEQADVPAAAFVAAAMALLLSRAPGDRRALAAAGAFASMAAWTKNEGALHLLLLGAIVLLETRRLRDLRAFVAGALPFIVLLVLFKAWVAPGNDLLQQSVGPALHRALTPERWWLLVTLIGRRLVLLQAWGLHLLCLIAWLFVTRKGAAASRRIRLLSLVPILTIAAYLGILLAQPHDLAFMFKVTIDRLLLQIWVPILLVVARS